MRVIVDFNTRPGQYAGGTRVDDVIFGDGFSNIMGGDGDDVINCAITDPRVFMGGSPILIYGGVGRNEANGRETVHPRAFTDKGPLGGLDNDGDDTIHYGIGYKVDGGSGADLYVSHGPSRAMGVFTPMIAAFNPREGDEFIFDHSDRSKGTLSDGTKTRAGFNVTDYDVDMAGNGMLILREVTIKSYSTNPIVGGQANVIHFDGEPGDWDGPRGHVSGKIMLEHEGGKVVDTVENWLIHHMGRESVDIGSSDHFDQFLF